MANRYERRRALCERCPMLGVDRLMGSYVCSSGMLDHVACKPSEYQGRVEPHFGDYSETFEGRGRPFDCVMEVEHQTLFDLEEL